METKTTKKKSFELGRIVATRGLAEYCEMRKFPLLPYIARHWWGDWGDVCQEDKKANDYSLEHNQRLLSSYHLPDGKKSG